MHLDEYQKAAGDYQLENAPPEERVFGLLEEAGELAGVFKRMLRGDFPPDVAASKLHKELGDIMWYLARVAADNGWDLSDVAKANLDKLESRKIRNVIMGQGDNR